MNSLISVAFFIVTEVSVLIEPASRQQWISPVLNDYELKFMKPLRFSCDMRAADGVSYVIRGTFGKPVYPKTDNRNLRPIQLVSEEPLEVSGAGFATMTSSGTALGWYKFEITMPNITYQFEMDHIVAGSGGYLKILSSKRKSGGGAPIWDFAGIGFCTTENADDEAAL